MATEFFQEKEAIPDYSASDRRLFVLELYLLLISRKTASSVALICFSTPCAEQNQLLFVGRRGLWMLDR